MVMPRVTRERLAASGFDSSQLARALAVDPIGLIDVGARWGVDPLFRPAAPLFAATAFEPDRDEAGRVAAREMGEGWAGVQVVTAALGARRGAATLHLLAKPNNSSIYPVDPAVAQRYALAGFELVRTEALELAPLDQLVRDGTVEARNAGEVLKLDVQGAEHDVLTGAAEILSARSVCVIAETPFFASYQGARLFSEIELLLRGHGLSFYGFLDFQHRGTRRLDKRRCRGRERMMQADAVFFRDPCDAGRGAASLRQVRVTLLMALLLGYFDFSLELASLLPEQEGREIAAMVPDLAAVDAEADAEAVRALVAESRDPERLHLLLTRLVDARRDDATVHDIDDRPAGASR